MKHTRFILPISIALATLFALLGNIKVTAETVATAAAQTAPYGDQRQAVQQAVNWLVETHQNDDGGYTSFSAGANAAPSDVAGTADAILAISSAGYNPAAVMPGQNNTPIAYLRQHAADAAAYAATDGSAAGKLILALAAANQNPRDFEGYNFVISLTNHLSPTGQFNVEAPFANALALLALRAVDEPAPPQSIDWLRGRQAEGGELDGSWDDGFGAAGNADATAKAVMALVAAGVPADDESLERAADFLTRTQVADGGWEYGPGYGVSANSTALVVQALSALKLDYYSPESPFEREDTTPLMALLTWQTLGGAFQADFGDGRFDDFFTTVQAIPAVTGKPYPLPGRYEAARQALDCLATLQDPATGGWEHFATFGVDAAGTSRALQAIAVLGEDPTSERWLANGVTPLAALAELTPAYLATGRGGAVGIVMQGVVAAGGDVRDFAGYDLVISTTNYLSPTGEYDDTAFGPFAHAEAMLGLLAADEAVDEAAVAWLLDAQTGGDWGGPDSTGIALQVLGRLDVTLTEAIDVLQWTQLLDGGWGFDATSPGSTSEVAQGLVAAGQNPFDPFWSKVMNGRIANAADAVLAQQGDNGCWPNLFGPGDDPFSTTDAILLLAQQPPWPEPAGAALGPEIAEATPSPVATETPQPAPTVTLGPTLTPTPTRMPDPGASPATVTPTALPMPTPVPSIPTTSNSSPLIVALGIVVMLGLVIFISWFIRRPR